MKKFIKALVLGLFVLAVMPVQQSQASALSQPGEQVSVFDLNDVSINVDYEAGIEMDYTIVSVSEGWKLTIDENQDGSVVYQSFIEPFELALYDDNEQGLSIDQVAIKAKLRKKPVLLNYNDDWIVRDAPKVYKAGLFAGLISGDGNTTVGDELTPTEPPSVFDWITTNWGLILALLLAISEILALIPGINQNGIFQAFYGWIKSKRATN